MSSIDSSVWRFLTGMESAILQAKDGGALDQKVLNYSQVKQIGENAIENFNANARSADLKSLAASVSGVLSIPCILGGLALGYSWKKDRNLQSGLFALAAFTVAIGLSAIWHSFRNYRDNLAQEARNTLQDKDHAEGEVVQNRATAKANAEGVAIDLIAQGADLADLGYDLWQIAAGHGYVKAFLYLAMLRTVEDPDKLKKDLTEVFLSTKHDTIAKVAVDLGINLESLDPVQAKRALDLSEDPTRVLHNAKHANTAKLAIMRRADASSCAEMDALFSFACNKVDDALISGLMSQNDSLAKCDIEDFNQWGNACIAYEAGEMSKTEESLYRFLNTLTYFEVYLGKYFEFFGKFERDQLEQILEVFGVDKVEAGRIARIEDLNSLWYELNDQGLRIRLSECNHLFNLISGINE